MDLNQLIKDVKGIPKKMRDASQVILNEQAPKLIEELRSRSPQDTGKYRRSWHKTGPRFTSRGVFASIVIRNGDAKAGLMEFGGEPREAPWYFPNSRKPSGKLTQSDGKIWAGGLTPGHGLTVGGAIDPVIFANDSRQLIIAEAIANNILRVI